MIKTDKSEKELSNPSSDEPVPAMFLLLAIVLIVGGYFLFAHVFKSSKQNVAALNQGNVKPLPLIIPSSPTSLNSTSSNQKSDSQSSTNPLSLSSNSINLQNNLPSGKGNTPTTNGLQSAGGAATGESINPSLGL